MPCNASNSIAKERPQTGQVRHPCPSGAGLYADPTSTAARVLTLSSFSSVNTSAVFQVIFRLSLMLPHLKNGRGGIPSVS